MNNQLKRTSLLLLSVMTTATVLSACGTDDAKTTTPSKGNAAAPTEAAKLAPVKLKWVVRATPQKDQQLVQDEMNKILKEKINAEVELVFIDPGAPYDQKVKTMIAANEDYDIMFTGGPSVYGDFYGSVSKGAFLPITDLLKKYAPKTYAQIPESFWKSVTVKGQMYAVLNYQIVARQNGIVAQKNIVDKYNFDLNKVTKFEDLEPLLVKIRDGEPKTKIPFTMDKTGAWNNMLTYYGLEPVGASNTVGMAKIDDASGKIINQYADPSFKQHITLLNDWFKKGLINKDAATLPSALTTHTKAGNTMTGWSNWKPGGEAEGKALYNGNDIVYRVLDKPFVTNENVSTTVQAINKKSKNPERAMMFIELLNTDKQLYNLITFGVQDKHYKKLSDNRIELVKDSAYYPNKAWAFGNQFNAYLQPGQEDNVWQQTIDLNAKAVSSKLLGFVFDQEPVKTEIAQCQSVFDEYLPGLWTGFVDPDKFLPEFLAKLQTAGADKIIAEKQKQLDAWKAGK